jgi:hypothetical protein
MGRSCRISREKYVEFIERDEYTLRHSPEHMTEAMLSPIKDLADIFFDFDWHIVRFDEPKLLTAEEPISYWRPRRQHSCFGVLDH